MSFIECEMLKYDFTHFFNTVHIVVGIFKKYLAEGENQIKQFISCFFELLDGPKKSMHIQHVSEAVLESNL